MSLLKSCCRGPLVSTAFPKLTVTFPGTVILLFNKTSNAIIKTSHSTIVIIITLILFKQQSKHALVLCDPLFLMQLITAGNLSFHDVLCTGEIGSPITISNVVLLVSRLMRNLGPKTHPEHILRTPPGSCCHTQVHQKAQSEGNFEET